MVDIFQGKVLMFKCCCEGRSLHYGHGIDLNTNLNKTGVINQDNAFIGKDRHPFLIITPTNKIRPNNYVTAIPITSQGDTYHNEAHSIKIIQDMIKKDNAKILDNSYLKIDMPTRIFLRNIDKDSSDCDQATFQSGKAFNEIITKVAEKHFSN